ncbi:MAG: rRNA pseudouridine synthase [Anaeromicrobium sp.]|uniref:pseudouridine synthase n=1 Tax=Anaeromicrobium sp. TaxID=1929132 RepID=UPI0025FF301E|nr:pseudouridine synthase [Anaeromicrobium sp.]MCT4592995.1 rRNA pseudouridine synthase [Anaeromicrobium sp.]
MLKKQRIDKVLSSIGYGTRKEIKEYLKRGYITVNGEVIKQGKTHVNPYEDVIKVNDEEINYREFVYIMLNKPGGVISATYDNLHETVVDLLEDEFRVFEPFPVGRLDKDTEGLLIITNDGKLSHEVLSPKKHVPKTYYAHIDGYVRDEHVKKFKEGVYIDEDYKTLPADLRVLETGDTSKIEVTIYEGKFHQVKRMFKAIGMEVVYLKRIQMGRLKIDETLELGQYREITKEEIEILKDRD